MLNLNHGSSEKNNATARKIFLKWFVLHKNICFCLGLYDVALFAFAKQQATFERHWSPNIKRFMMNGELARFLQVQNDIVSTWT